MRPINQGNKPQKAVAVHRDYFDNMKGNIGCFCSYCERPLPNSELQVEHIRSRSTNREYLLCWNNLLLSCFTCNSHKEKSEKKEENINDLNVGDYAFPHIYDTYHLIDYPSPTYMPVCSKDAEANYRPKVEKLLQLLHLSNDTNLTEAELLQENEIPSYRIKVGEEAEELKRDLGINYTEEQIECTKKKIKRCIESKGFWSIWMKYFEDIDEIKLMLLDLIPGTEKRFFQDEQTHRDCEREHIYNDIIGTLEHRLEYKIEKGTIENEQEWLQNINESINTRIPDLTKEENEKIQSYITDLSD